MFLADELPKCRKFEQDLQPLANGQIVTIEELIDMLTPIHDRDNRDIETYEEQISNFNIVNMLTKTPLSYYEISEGTIALYEFPHCYVCITVHKGCACCSGASCMYDLLVSSIKYASITNDHNLASKLYCDKINMHLSLPARRAASVSAKKVIQQAQSILKIPIKPNPVMQLVGYGAQDLYLTAQSKII
jgi:hypothetical protein